MTVGRTLRDRVAAQSAMAAVIAAQADGPPRSGLKRLLGVSPLSAGSRSAYRDALAELLVGDMLDNLGQQWDVLHDVPLGSSTLDHLAIGPAGVFAVRAANHGDRDVVVDGDILIAGEPTGDVPEALRQSETAAQRLSAVAGGSVVVHPLVVVAEPRRFTERRVPDRVRVVRSADLERMLHREPRALDGPEVARISDLADLESTWPAPQPQSLDVQSLHRSFALIRDEVRSALRRRLLWATGALAVGFVVLWVLVARAVALVVAS